MDKENPIVYVDLSRPSSVMSNVTYNQGKKFNAYTEQQEGRTYFINVNYLIQKLGIETATELLKGATKNA